MQPNCDLVSLLHETLFGTSDGPKSAAVILGPVGSCFKRVGVIIVTLFTLQSKCSCSSSNTLRCDRITSSSIQEGSGSILGFTRLRSTTLTALDS